MIEFKEEAVADMFAALIGGVESLRALVLVPSAWAGPFPAVLSESLVAELKRVASDTANGLRVDLRDNRAGCAIAADLLPGVRPFVEKVQGRVVRFPIVASADSLRAVSEGGDFARTLRELSRLRPLNGVSEGARVLFRLCSNGSAVSDAAQVLLKLSHAESEAIFLARRNCQLRTLDQGGGFGDLVEAACGDVSDAFQLRAFLWRLAKRLWEQNPESSDSLPFEAQYTLRHCSCAGQGGSQVVSRLEGLTVATFLGIEISIWS